MGNKRRGMSCCCQNPKRYQSMWVASYNIFVLTQQQIRSTHVHIGVVIVVNHASIFSPLLVSV